MFNKDKKNSFDILSKKAKLEKVSILKEFSKISNIVAMREAKLESAKTNLLDLDKKMLELESKNKLVAHYGGDGKLLHEFIKQQNLLNREKNKLEAKMDELRAELSVAQSKYDEVKKIVVRYSARNSILEGKLESLEIEEIESRNYQEEISNQERSVRSKK